MNTLRAREVRTIKDTMSFYLACEEMKEENLEALHPNITGLDVCHVFEWKGNLTDSTVWNTGETGGMNPCCS